MSTRASSLQATNLLAINREIDSKYDAVLAVRDKLTEIELVAGLDIEQILVDLQEAQDFTGINVVAGDVAAWDPVTKTITVPTVKGDTGAQGLQGIQGPVGPQGAIGPRGLTGAAGANGRDGRDGTNGTDGIDGIDGIDGLNLTVEQITYDGNTGKFVWQFSDGTSYTTPDLRGPKGDVGDKGDKGDTGLGVHHIKGTSTTNSTGDFGISPFRDTYTLYGDAAETINLGHFTVANGVSDGMSMEVYDANANGIVDNSERLGGELPSHYVNIVGDQSIGGNKTFAGNVTVQGDLVVNGESITVNAATVEVEDNLLVINKGEVGNGVTAGEAGILVDRGTATDYKFVWEETSQAFKIGEIGGLQKVATREDAPTIAGIAVWNDTADRFDTTLDVKVDSIQLNGGSGAEGLLSWNADEGTVDLGLPGGSVLQIGQENVRTVRNSTASTITNGTVCMFNGTIGNSGRIKVKPFTGGFNEAMYVYGVATQDIAAGADGLITIEGKVRGIDTTGASVGEVWLDEDILYVKPGDNGRLTKIVPTVSELRMPIASVIKAHTNGTLEIRFTPLNENQFEPRNANIQTHIARVDNPHNVTKTQIGLGNVDNIADINKNVLSATKWTTARTIILSGDVTGSVSMDGTANVSITTTIQPNSVALGTDTTGNYVAGVTQGTGISVTGTAGEGWTPTVALTNVGTAGTYRSVTTDAQGRVTAGTNPTTVAGYGLTDVYTKTESDAALGLKAPLTSPTFTGTPATPTASVGTSTTQIASTAFVVAEINKIEEW